MTAPPATDDTYPSPRHGWNCFHCGEHFSSSESGQAAAREHFGPTPGWSPLCIERKTLSDDSLLKLSRKARLEAEEFLRQRHEAEDDAEAAHCRMSALHRFPAKSLDEAFHMFHSMEGRALAAEAMLKAATRLAPEAVAQARVEVCGPEPRVGVTD
jgi:hypothetical protein